LGRGLAAPPFFARQAEPTLCIKSSAVVQIVTKLELNKEMLAESDLDIEAELNQ
jgi:hypothetical protein